MNLKGKKLFIVCNDAGAAQAVIPSYKEFKADGLNIAIIARHSGYHLSRNAGIKVCGRKEAYSDYKKIKKFLSEQRPDVILTGTSLKDDLERNYIKAGKILNIIVISFVDWWTNFKTRFMHTVLKELCLPDWICVVDRTAKKLCLKEIGALTNIAITGNPYFTHVAGIKEMSRQDRKAVIRSLDLNPGLSTILFFPEPAEPSIGYDQFFIFGEIASAMEMAIRVFGASFNLIIKFHPSGEKSAIYSGYEKIVRRYLRKGVRVNFVKKGYNINELIGVSDYVWGMCTTPLLEAVIRGKLTSSFTTGLDIPGIPFLKREKFCASEDKAFRFSSLVQRLLIDKKYKAAMMRRQKRYRTPEENFTGVVRRIIQKEMRKRKCYG